MVSTFRVSYTKRIGGKGTILVKAHNEQEALIRAKHLCFTGSEFRNPILTDEVYIKPRKQGFYGSCRMN